MTLSCEFPMGLKCPPLEIKIMLESNSLKPRGFRSIRDSSKVARCRGSGNGRLQAVLAKIPAVAAVESRLPARAGQDHAGGRRAGPFAGGRAVRDVMLSCGDSRGGDPEVYATSSTVGAGFQETPCGLSRTVRPCWRPARASAALAARRSPRPWTSGLHK